jgi:hypothetical protein
VASLFIDENVEACGSRKAARQFLEDVCTGKTTPEPEAELLVTAPISAGERAAMMRAADTMGAGTVQHA